MSGVGERTRSGATEALEARTTNPALDLGGAWKSSQAWLSRGSASRHPLVLTVEEAADQLGVGRTVMYALVSSGAVESVRIGRLRRVPADALVAFLDALRDCQRGGAA